MSCVTTFKSLNSEVKTNEDLDEILGHALIYQYMFDNKTSPWERSSWGEDELENFKIDVDCIDRLYFVSCIRYGDYSEAEYAMLARMEYNGKKVFIDFSASCDSTGFDCQGGGETYVTFDVNIFYNVIVSVRNDSGCILESLQEDGYDITILPGIATVPSVSSWHNPMTLRFLCHVTIKDNLPSLQHYTQVLPKCLVDSVTEYIKIKEASEKLHEW
nr:hypothetical protein MmNV_37 [Menippe mercenaria nudivirus]